MSSIPFRYLRHFLTVPVVVDNSVEARFALDTGIGLTLFSETLCKTVGCTPNGSTFVGRRMSGQEVTVPLASAPALAMGSAMRDDLVIGVFDMSGFPDEFDGIDGFLSLEFFAARPFTIDHPRGLVCR